jgi:hypothetical protein
MIRKFLAVILVIALALPAVFLPSGPVAASDAAVQMPSHSMHHGATEQQPGGYHHGTDHGCIGCIAPYNTFAAVPVAPPLTGMVPLSWLPRALPSRHFGPEVPPPRNA